MRSWFERVEGVCGVGGVVGERVGGPVRERMRGELGWLGGWGGGERMEEEEL